MTENKELHINKNVTTIKNRKKKKENDTAYVLKFEDSTKTQAGTRTIPLSTKALEALRILKEMGDSQFIINTESGHPMCARSLRSTFDYILANANVEPAGLHSLRHSFASRLFRKGATPKTVSELLGHANIQITLDTYVHLIPKQKEDVISLLDD